MKLFALAFMAAVSLGSVQAAEVASAAKERARLYQEEAYNVLFRHGWHIELNQRGKIIADHPLGMVADLGGSGHNLGLTDTDSERLAMFAFTQFARMMLTFVPESGSRTACTADIVTCYYDRTYGGKLSKPRPFNSPDSTKKIQGMMAEAEKQLAAKHPEYTAH